MQILSGVQEIRWAKQPMGKDKDIQSGKMRKMRLRDLVK